MGMIRAIGLRRLLATVMLVTAVVVAASACSREKVTSDPYVGSWWTTNASADGPYALSVTAESSGDELVADGTVSARPADLANDALRYVVRSPVAGLGRPGRFEYVRYRLVLTGVHGDVLSADWYGDGARYPPTRVTYRRVRAAEGSLRQGFAAIVRGVQRYAVDHSDCWPAPRNVRPANAEDIHKHTYYNQVGACLPAWPANPFTGKPMRLHRGPGDFDYRQVGKGASESYAFIGYGTDGKPLVVLP